MRIPTSLLATLMTCVVSSAALQTARASDAPQSSTAQSSTSQSTAPKWDVPTTASPEELAKFIEQTKKAELANNSEFRQQQMAIRDASNLLLKALKEQGDTTSQAYRQAEFEFISSRLAIMASVGENARQKTIDETFRLLKSRKQLSAQDVTAGIMAATYLEQQPNKAPAREIYELMVELLQEDERKEMQNLRLRFEASIRRLSLLGKKLELDAVSVKGKRIRTEDYGGKYVLVDFFATWCEECLAEVPRFRKHLDEYGDDELAIIGISIDQKRQDLDNYLARSQLPWPIVHDDAKDFEQRMQFQFGIFSFPSVMLLNKEGTVVSLAAYDEELDRLMKVLFESPTPAPQLPEDAAKQEATNRETVDEQATNKEAAVRSPSASATDP